jgi:hypothetical protein
MVDAINGLIGSATIAPLSRVAQISQQQIHHFDNGPPNLLAQNSSSSLMQFLFWY